jgi:hypothetical protein
MLKKNFTTNHTNTTNLFSEILSLFVHVPKVLVRVVRGKNFEFIFWSFS